MPGLLAHASYSSPPLPAPARLPAEGAAGGEGEDGEAAAAAEPREKEDPSFYLRREEESGAEYGARIFRWVLWAAVAAVGGGGVGWRGLGGRVHGAAWFGHGRLAAGCGRAGKARA